MYVYNMSIYIYINKGGKRYFVTCRKSKTIEKHESNLNDLSVRSFYKDR